MEVLVYTRVMYHLPYVTVSRLQNNKLETLLGKCTRLALGVQRLTPIHFLRQTGLLNPLQDRVAYITTCSSSAHERQHRRQIPAHQNHNSSILLPIPQTVPP